MLRSSVKTGVLVSGGAAIVLLLAGCNDGGTASPENPQVPTIPESTSQQQQPPPSATTPPPVTSSPSTVANGQQPPTPAGGSSTECKVPDLKLSFGGGDAAAGTSYRALVFTNKGSRTCTIQGFPGVSYVAGDDGHQVGPAAYRNGNKGAAVTLKPGGTAYADIGFVEVRNYDPAVCKPTEVRGLRIYPPHEYNSMFIAAPGTGCAGTPPGNQLTVATVKPGSGPAA